jgi:hypothetical protein
MPSHSGENFSQIADGMNLAEMISLLVMPESLNCMT